MDSSKQIMLHLYDPVRLAHSRDSKMYVNLPVNLVDDDDGSSQHPEPNTRMSGSKVPSIPFARQLRNERLAKSLPIIGLGCSSFSTFFWTKEELSQQGDGNTGCFTAETLRKDHLRVQEWINTIHYAVKTCGIYLLDTAPWYGHGTSEVTIGFAMMQDNLKEEWRDKLVINTKVGRYQADPTKQFDFSYQTTLDSIQRSIERMNCDYIDVLQLHDPEFAPSLDILFQETIPAMRYAQEQGWCRALGMTGYPLQVQYQILQRSLEEYQGVLIWDQALTYGHFNLHNTSLVQGPITKDQPSLSFATYCSQNGIGLLAAAPLSMGLLASTSSPSWHPAPKALKEACHKACTLCQEHNVDIATLAVLFALSGTGTSGIACTIIGCKNIEEVEEAASVARRFQAWDNTSFSASQQQGISKSVDLLEDILTKEERLVLDMLQDQSNGPFANVWKNGEYLWDGVKEAQRFWETVEGNPVVKRWQEALP